MSQKNEYQENLKQAAEEMDAALASPNFRLSDFEDICLNHGVDQDDLLFELI